MYSIDLIEFDKNLSLTRAYCELQLQCKGKSVAEIFRSYNPEYNGKLLFSYENQGFVYKKGSFNSVKCSTHPLYEDADLCKRLYNLQSLHKGKTTFNSLPALDHKGRILIAEIDQTVVDGASEMESEGLIDLNDCPPIDTWVYLTSNKKGKILFAWIPEPFVSLAQATIDVNCIDCLFWYQEQL